jgi:glucose/mannose-6-phosphate isomerase
VSEDASAPSVDLDDPSGFGAVDLDDALADVEATAVQWAHARALAQGFVADLDGITAILVPGMGGSGVSGDVVATLAKPVLDLPVVVSKGYGTPAWVGPRTLVLAASYSGETEETLSAVERSLAQGARVVAVTSGGSLGALAADHGLPTVAIPAGRQPRHSLGYLALPLLVALGLDEGIDEAIELLAVLAGRWDRKTPLDEHAPKALGARFAGRAVPVVYGTQGMAALAGLRLVCQLNENAKLPALNGDMPEICHNAIVGWEGPSDLAGRAGLVWVRDPASEHPRNSARATLVADLLDDRVAWQATIAAQGTSALARLAALLLHVDLVSIYAALARGIDPTPVRSISALKEAMR